MATPTALPSSFTAGDVLTAANMNLLRGAFRILQVVSTTKTDTFTTSSTTLVDVTGYSVSITPGSTSSKVLVVGYLMCGVDVNNSRGMYGTLLRDTTAIGVGATAGNRSLITTDFAPGTNTSTIASVAFTYLDSPATTSATTYKLQIRSQTAAALYVNRSITDTDNSTFTRSASTITAYEVSA